MFDFDAGKIIIVGVIALVFIPPKDLPRVLRQAGQFVGKMRRMANEFQGQFMDAMREADIADLRREAQSLSDAARTTSGLDDLRHLNRDLTGALHRDATVPNAVSQPVVEPEPVMLPTPTHPQAPEGAVRASADATSLAAAAREHV